MSYNNDANPLKNMRHERMTAWACVNAILAYCGQTEALWGEWRDAVYTDHDNIDPGLVAHRIMKWRRERQLAA